MGENFSDENDLTEATDVDNTLKKEMTSSSIKQEEAVVWKPKGFFNSFGLLMREQKQRWPWYLVLTIGCVGAGCKSSITSMSTSCEALFGITLLTLFQQLNQFKHGSLHKLSMCQSSQVVH